MCNGIKLIETKDGVVLEVFVKPNSQNFEVRVEEGAVVVYCTNEPVKGKVNKEIIKTFSKFFHSRVEIVSGVISKKKVILFRGSTKTEIEKRLKVFLALHFES